MPVNIDMPLTKAEIIKMFDRHVTTTEPLLLDQEGELRGYKVHEWRVSPPEDQLPPPPEHNLPWTFYPMSKVLNVKEIVLGDGNKVKLERRW